ncbi:MAG: hypothetical protein ACYTFK_11410 [Planctomycetota bacterium]|jgi:hypothetical protein
MEIWFNERTAGLIGGLIGSFIGGFGGAVIGCCLRKGNKKFVYGYYGFIITISVAISVVGLVALIAKQPRHVWYAFLLPGLLSTVIFTSLFPVIRKRFIESEMRQMQAKDL